MIYAAHLKVVLQLKTTCSWMKSRRKFLEVKRLCWSPHPHPPAKAPPPVTPLSILSPLTLPHPTSQQPVTLSVLLLSAKIATICLRERSHNMTGTGGPLEELHRRPHWVSATLAHPAELSFYLFT